MTPDMAFKMNPDGSATFTASIPTENIPAEYLTPAGIRAIEKWLEARLRVSLPVAMRDLAATTARELMVGN